MQDDSEARIKLVAIDVDGTLLTSARMIHSVNAKWIRIAIARGITVVLASGRVYASMQPFLAELDLLDAPVICANGAHVRDRGRRDLSTAFLPRHTVELLVDYALTTGVHLNAYTTDAVFFLRESRWGDLYRRRVVHTSPRVASSDHIRSLSLLKLMFVDAPEVVLGIGREIARLLADTDPHVTISEPEYLEILPSGVSKGLALSRLATHLGIERRDVAAIGDFHNDVEMLTWAGTGVVMQGAPDSVKAVADIIAPSNDEAGVAWYLRSIVLDKGF